MYQYNELPQWAISKIKHIQRLAAQRDYLYKYTSDTIHEDEKHYGKSITEMLDICIKNISLDKKHPIVTSFKNTETMRDLTSNTLEGNIEKSVLWANRIGDDKNEKRLRIKSDVMFDDIGHGITWDKNGKMIYITAKSAVVILRRKPNDINDIDYRRVTTYLDLEPNRRKYPDAVIFHKNFDLVPYMLKTEAYKNTKTDAERQRLLSYVQRPNNNQQPFEYQKDIPMDSDFSNRDIESSHAIDQYVNQQKSFENIQRNIGETQTNKRHVNLNLTENKFNDKYDEYN